ncbi:Hypothetical_protein [Hexamita inflata]|uniref:Hypothetical_protein n=1 Tax=Hexamita inflata TaxID=28002 RepID=A0ABP1HKJ2_9EUKA
MNVGMFNILLTVCKKSNEVKVYIALGIAFLFLYKLYCILNTRSCQNPLQPTNLNQKLDYIFAVNVVFNFHLNCKLEVEKTRMHEQVLKITYLYSELLNTLSSIKFQEEQIKFLESLKGGSKRRHRIKEQIIQQTD